MLWTGFRAHLVGGTLATVLAAIGITRLLRPWWKQTRSWSQRKFWLTWPFIVVVCLLSIRSSIDHRPANPALFALTGDPMVNTLILNSAWSVTHLLRINRLGDRWVVKLERLHRRLLAKPIARGWVAD